MPSRNPSSRRLPAVMPASQRKSTRSRTRTAESVSSAKPSSRARSREGWTTQASAGRWDWLRNSKSSTRRTRSRIPAMRPGNSRRTSSKWPAGLPRHLQGREPFPYVFPPLPRPRNGPKGPRWLSGQRNGSPALRKPQRNRKSGTPFSSFPSLPRLRNLRSWDFRNPGRCGP